MAELDTTVTALLTEMGCPSPTPSIDLDTVNTSLENISALESSVSSNRSSRNLEETSFLSEQFPDLIPRNVEKFVQEKDTKRKIIVKDESTKQTETIILLSILFLTIVSIYLFPPP